jgi:hypothetical protein
MAITDSMTPSSMVTIATNQTRILGSIKMTTPKIMKTNPGKIKIGSEGGFIAMPLHIDAIGHIAIGSFE